MKKAVYFIILTTALFASISTSYSQKDSQEIDWIPFYWESHTFQGKIFEKAAMMIPATIDNIPQKFKMQFDLGANRSILYAPTLKRFLKEYPVLKNKIKVQQFMRIDRVEDVNLQLGEVLFKNIDLALINFGNEIISDSINSETEIVIGTVGADLFQNKILIIDYKLNRLAVSNTLPAEYQNVSFVNCKKKRGRVHIPFLINGKKEYLLFDTGASLFRLFTTKQRALDIGGKEIVDFFEAPSWGISDSFYGLETVVPIIIGNREMEKSIVYYVGSNRFDNFIKRSNIWGTTGNAFFSNDVVIIDFKKNRFGIN